MAVRVKIRRLKLLQLLEQAKQRKIAAHEKHIEKYNEALAKARTEIVKELRAKADAIEAGEDVYLRNESRDKEQRPRKGQRYGRTVYVNMLCFDSKITVPRKPERNDSEIHEIERCIKLLDASEEDTITVGETDLRTYGIGSALALEDD